MPLYDYRCTCGWSGEANMPVDMRNLFICPNCFRNPERLLAAPMGKIAGQTAKGGGADRLVADMLRVPVKDLPAGLRTDQKQCDSSS